MREQIERSLDALSAAGEIEKSSEDQLASHLYYWRD